MTEASAHPRLFFALWPPPALARQLRQWAQSAFDDTRARLLGAEQLHLTLIYLGPSSAAQRECAETLAGRLHVEPFELRLTTPGYWPRPRVGWIAPAESPSPLVALVEGLRGQLSECGYRIETRPWQAHVTLLRKLRRPPTNIQAMPPLRWQVRDFALVESQTRPAGAEYRILQRWPLVANECES